MKVNIYYGGRGLVVDPTLFAIEKITKVLEECEVVVERFNLYEDKNSITVLPKTLKDADGIILAASVEWYGVGGLLQQFLDACWLYGDKEKISHIYMFPVVMATTYGEREAEYSLIRAWEMLGGVPSEGLCAYVEDHIEFETSAEYNLLLEKKTENFFRMMSKKTIAFPTSSMQVKKKVSRSSAMQLTPQESDVLSEYNADGNYVKKTKEDIEDLAHFYKGLLGGTNSESEKDDFVEMIKEHFYPIDGLKATFVIDVVDDGENLVIEIDDDKLNCYRGKASRADVVAKVKRDVFETVVSGKHSLQNVFMSGKLTAQGNFKILRNFDSLFRFGEVE